MSAKNQADTVESIKAQNASLAASLAQAQKEADELRAKLASVGADTDTVRRVFGYGPEDVIFPSKSASDVCDWLEELFKTIRDEVTAGTQQVLRYRIRALADMGAYVASDFSNHFDCGHEDLFNRLKEAGVVPADRKRLDD